ncbi:hypothetical protein [Sphingobium yanoikuyae]|uniref:hypothetical protein n=1 Tax=Sphingobium yanoikuyae TaxID=13690 RepID=UPI0028AEEECB|nr:hypothetical protein [Sphingobium yanoikuyae]
MSEGGAWISITHIHPSDRERVRKRLASGIMKARAEHYLEERPEPREIKPFPPGSDPLAEILKEGVLRVDQIPMTSRVVESQPIDKSFWSDPSMIWHPLWSEGDFEIRRRDGWDGKDSYLGIEIFFSGVTETSLPDAVATPSKAGARRGPKPKYDWHSFISVAVDRLSYQGGFNAGEWGKAELLSEMLQWCERQWGDNIPEKSTLYQKIAEAEKIYAESGNSAKSE